MDKATLLGTWIRRFLLEHLVGERNLAPNTQRSYRDTLVLLLPFVAKKAAKAVDRLSVVDMSAELIRLFFGRFRNVSSLCDRNPQSATGGHSRPGPLCGRAQPRVHRLVRSNSGHPVQEADRPSCHSLP